MINTGARARAEAARKVRNAEIVRLRVEEGLWPFQIAEKMGLHRALVSTVLRAAGHGTPTDEVPQSLREARAQRLVASNEKRRGRKSLSAQVAELAQQNYPTWMIATKLRISRKVARDLRSRARAKAKRQGSS